MLTLADVLDFGNKRAAPGPRGHAVLGSLPAARRDPIRLFMEAFRDHGEMVRYFPFGGGPRLCIGNGFAMIEAQLVLATLAQRVKFELQPGHPVVLDPSITLRPRYGMKMRVA